MNIKSHNNTDSHQLQLKDCLLMCLLTP